jgi:amidase
LGVGDCYALMRDGESVFWGMEVAGQAALRCGIPKDFSLTAPLLLTPEKAMTVASAKTLDADARKDLDNMALLWSRAQEIDYVEATMLVRIGADVPVGQLVNRRVTVNGMIQRSLLPLPS